MPHYPYIIVGGGMSAAAAVQGIRGLDPDGEILLFTQEQDPPYKRPPLTKGLWQDTPEDKIWMDVDVDHLEILTRHRVQSIEPANQLVFDADGASWSYDRLLLATGGTPVRLPFGDDAIHYYRTYRDYLHLRQSLKDGSRVVVIGGGFIGQELSASLAMNGHKVTLVFPEDGVGARIYPPDLSAHLNEYYRQKGVDVRSGESVSGVEARSGEKVVTTESGAEIAADVVIGAIGIRTNTALAQAAGLQVEEHGVVVNEFLQSSQPDIYATGDIAAFYSPLLEMRLRLEHEDAATSTGKAAGRNMAGVKEPYDYLPFFYSDLFDLGYEAVGRTNSKLESFADWEEKFRKGVVYYLDEGRVRGVLLWNVWDKVDAARGLLAEAGPFKPEDLKGKIKG